MTDIDKRLDEIFDKNIKTYASIDTKTGRPLEVTIKGLEEAKQELKQLINEVRKDELNWFINKIWADDVRADEVYPALKNRLNQLKEEQL